jgi:phenylacetate-CoA ligase
MIWNRDAETMPRDRLGALQLERLQSTVRRAYERVPLYRRRFDEAGLGPADVRSLDDLARVPFTRKSDLRDTYPFGMFAVPREEVVRIHASSGTRGKPTVVGYTRADLAVWSEVMARSLGCAGVRPGDVLHVAYGYGLFTGGLGFHQGGELMGCTVIPMSGGNTPRQILMMQDLGSQVLCCTPSYALNIADVLDDLQVEPASLKLRVGVFGAEPWTEEMRAEIQRRLGIAAVDVYGLSEVIGPGVSCECVEARAGGHVMEDHFLVEVVDPASGEPLAAGREGELVFTSLTKEALPIIRYRTGDISTLDPSPCECGRTTVRMRRVRARYDDMLIIRGVNLYPSEVERVLLGFPELAPHYQLVVDRVQALDSLEAQAEVAEGVARGLGPWTGEADPLPAGLRELKGRVERTLRDECGVSIQVRLVPPRGVPRSEGKAVRVIDRRK